MLFGLEYESDKDKEGKVIELGKTIDEGLSKQSFFKNPFRGYVLFTKDKILFRITPLYLNPLIVGMIVLAAVLFLSRMKLTAFLIFPIIILLGSVFWFEGSYKFLIKIIIKKRGYTGKVEWMGSDECFDEVVLCGVKEKNREESD